MKYHDVIAVCPTCNRRLTVSYVVRDGVKMVAGAWSCFVHPGEIPKYLPKPIDESKPAQ